MTIHSFLISPGIKGQCWLVLSKHGITGNPLSLQLARQWEAGSSSLRFFSYCCVTLGQEQPPNHPDYTTETGRAQPQGCLTLNCSPFNQKALLRLNFVWGALVLLCQGCPGILGLKCVVTMKTCLITTCDTLTL